MILHYCPSVIINWISTNSKGNGIRWISGKSSEDLEFADDLAAVRSALVPLTLSDLERRDATGQNFPADLRNYARTLT